ncbi:MAG: TMEM165/GDT1 family protein [Candidatus Competibacter denitrificans]
MNDFLVTASTTLGVVALAELGDKTQLVCMTLAARHPPAPVLLGAISAFALLNLLAVLFGAAVAAWLPQ